MNKNSNKNGVFVKSHVGRDILQNAALFKNEYLVVWEYVSNGLEYVDYGVNPKVIVSLESRTKKIIIDDNGRGMDIEGIKNFFIMHGENIDRKKGKPGRGRFGTGKSAAFGIADILRITTVRNKKRSIVELDRNDILASKSEDPIPVKIIEKEFPVDLENGTRIEIEIVHLKSLDQDGIIKYIERHLAKWKNAAVFVNNQECSFAEPPISRTLEVKPDIEYKSLLGNVTLIIKIASSPLNEENRGISIFSNGIWHETTLAGNENREMSNYIFGEIDVPALDEDDSPIPPFDLSRSMRLNPNNEIVKSIYGFIGYNVDKIRRELVAEEKNRKKSEEGKKLANQAKEIEKYINNDFIEFKNKIIRIKAQRRTGFDYSKEIDNKDIQGIVIPGHEIPSTEISPDGNIGAIGDKGGGGKKPRSLMPQMEIDNDAPMKGKIVGESSSKKRESGGGFSVEYRNMGPDENRAKYNNDQRTIFINLDHPQLVAAKGGKEEYLFNKLSYEIAFTEYAIVLSSELNASGEYSDISDAIVDVRMTINRIAKKAAELYRTS